MSFNPNTVDATSADTALSDEEKDNLSARLARINSIFHQRSIVLDLSGAASFPDTQSRSGRIATTDASEPIPEYAPPILELDKA